MAIRKDVGIFIRQQDSGPMTFLAPISMDRSGITEFVVRNGGNVLAPLDKVCVDFSITLCSRQTGAKPVDVDVFDVQYVLDCEQKGMLLDNLRQYRLYEASLFKEDYDPMDILKGNLKWSQLTLNGAENQGDVCSDLSDFGEDQPTVGHGRYRASATRTPYSRIEEIVIVRYLVESRSYGLVKGRKVWQEMAKETKTRRTWQSLKEHFLKTISTKFHRYDFLTPNNIRQFNRGLKQLAIHGIDEQDASATTVIPCSNGSAKVASDFTASVVPNVTAEPSPPDRASVLQSHEDESDSSSTYVTAETSLTDRASFRSHKNEREPSPCRSSATTVVSALNVSDFTVNDAELSTHENESEPSSCCTSASTLGSFQERFDGSPESPSGRITAESMDGDSSVPGSDNNPDVDVETMKSRKFEQPSNLETSSQEGWSSPNRDSDLEHSFNRRNYSRQEDKAILRYLIKTRNFSSLKSCKVWKSMGERLGVRRTWQSMKNRFLKVIVNDLQSYKLTARTVERFQRALANRKKAKVWKEPPACSRTDSFLPEEDEELTFKSIRRKTRMAISPPNHSTSVEDLSEREDAEREKIVNPMKKKLFHQSELYAESPVEFSFDAATARPPFRFPLTEMSASTNQSEKAMNTSRIWRPYDRSEDVAILRIIASNNSFSDVKGNELWKWMEAEQVCPGRTYQSMKERFRKRIVGNLSQFKDVITNGHMKALLKHVARPASKK